MGRVPGPAGSHLRWNRVASNGPSGIDDLLHREAYAISQIKDIVLPSFEEIVQGQYMGLGQVGHMDIVSDTGPIFGGIVILSLIHILCWRK